MDNKPSLYKQFLDAYWGWYQQTEGIIPRINAVEGKALKQLITYYLNLSEGNPDLAIASWKATLQHWNRLDNFYKKQKDLKQINSNINAIIRQIKHPQQGTSQSYREQVLKDLQS